jgi:predicted alpha-1,6-mannanase (GH76 family)
MKATHQKIRAILIKHRYNINRWVNGVIITKYLDNVVHLRIDEKRGRKQKLVRIKKLLETYGFKVNLSDGWNDGIYKGLIIEGTED